MELTVRDAMATAMWRFHDAALERATLIYTFARSTHEDTHAGSAIYMRQLPMLIDLVHEFCFNARRAIERADRYRPGTIANLQAMKVRYARNELALAELDHPKSISLSQESFWWILGRTIHRIGQEPVLLLAFRDLGRKEGYANPNRLRAEGLELVLKRYNEHELDGVSPLSMCL